MEINDDDIVLVDNDDVKVVLCATGGNEDPVDLQIRIGRNVIDCSIPVSDIDGLQQALLGFLNTGYFNQEG
jgi:hypothetical protein